MFDPSRYPNRKYRVTVADTFGALNYYRSKAKAVQYGKEVMLNNPAIVCQIERFDIDTDEYILVETLQAEVTAPISVPSSLNQVNR